ncbi:hypothetical protein ABZW30_41310 [Kitasatospora sp. NPDC004669]|uniref:hypothetical protein n=1 Tax=Kitasatospora sp. NPDC004669 TaxID=3154555 RepID=UPI0033B9BCEF
MRANHATKPQEPAPRGVAGARRAIARWLPRPRTVAAGGALLAQVWGVGALGAYAASAEALPGQAQPAVRRTLHGGTVIDGQSAARPEEPGHPAAAEPGRSPGLIGELTGGAPVDQATGAVGGVLRERIRAGGLPLPGQRAAVPDAFALASGLLGTAPARARPAETRAAREGEPAEPATVPQPRSPRPVAARPRSEAAEAPAVREAAAVEGQSAVEPAGATGVTEEAADPAVPTDGGTPQALDLADTATVDDGSATATAVLAPVAAGLLLTGAAVCKHRGLPRGH